MAGSKSDYLETALINAVLRNTAYSSPATVYIGLFTAAPSDTGGGTEVSGNAYARQSVAFSAPSPAGVTANSADVTFPTPTGAWGTVVAYGIFDASTAGNLLYWADLTQNEVVASGNIVKFLAGDIDISES